MSIDRLPESAPKQSHRVSRRIFTGLLAAGAATLAAEVSPVSAAIDLLAPQDPVQKSKATQIIRNPKFLDTLDEVYNYAQVTDLSLLLAMPSNRLTNDQRKELQTLLSGNYYSLQDLNLNSADFLNEQAVILEEPWSTAYWFPLDPDEAAKRELPLLYEIGGGLDIHDKLRGLNDRGARYFNEIWTFRLLNPDPVKPEDEPIRKMHRENPDFRISIGWCAQHAFAGTLEKRPVAGIYSEVAKVGGLVAKHGDDGGIGVDKRIVANVLRNERTRIVVDLPNDEPGRWFRVNYGADGELLLVTDFGKEPIYLPARDVVQALVPIYGPTGGNPRLRAATAAWGNPYLDRKPGGTLDYLVAA